MEGRVNLAPRERCDTSRHQHRRLEKKSYVLACFEREEREGRRKFVPGRSSVTRMAQSQSSCPSLLV